VYKRCILLIILTFLYNIDVCITISMSPISVQTSCTTDDVALADGRSAMEGRVEVCRGGVWGAVYGEWTFSNARVICRQLRFPSECELRIACKQ